MYKDLNSKNRTIHAPNQGNIQRGAWDTVLNKLLCGAGKTDLDTSARWPGITAGSTGTYNRDNASADTFDMPGTCVIT